MRRRHASTPTRALPALGALVLITLVVSGCATAGPLTVRSPAAASVAGDPMRQRIEKRDVVQVRLLTPGFSRKLEELPAFDVAVTNRGATPLSFAASDVVVHSGSNPVRVYTAGELVDRIQKEAEQEAREKTGASAEKILQTRSTNGDPSSAIVKIERDKMLDQSATARATSNERFAEIVKSIVPVSISPGGTGSGVIKLHAEDIRAGQPLQIVVTVGGERYEFIFEVGRAGT